MLCRPNPKIAIVGAGAIGSLVGGLLAHHGQDVTLIARKAHVEAIQKNGLYIDGVAGDRHIQIRAAEVLDFKPDLTFIAVKSQDVSTVCETIQPFVTEGPVVMMQNGVTSAQTAAAFFGKQRIIGCTLMLNARFLSPGKVTYANENPIVIGRAFGDNDEAVSRLQGLLNHVAPTAISDDILGVQWSKLMVNAFGNAMDSMTGLEFHTSIQYTEMCRIGAMIIKEAVGLMNRAKIRSAPLKGLPLFFFKIISLVPTPIAMQLLKLAAKSKARGQVLSSTMQSLRKRQPTEIDYINGEFVRLAGQLCVPAPVNQTVVDVIHEIEQTHQFYTPADLMKKFNRAMKAAGNDLVRISD